MSNKLYRGVRQNGVAKAYVDNTELSLETTKQMRPSEATVEWGYFGEGPSCLSLAILFDATQDKENSLKYYHDFKRDFIANIDYNLGFIILQTQVQEWLQQRIADDSRGWAI